MPEAPATVTKMSSGMLGAQSWLFTFLVFRSQRQNNVDGEYIAKHIED